MDLDTNAKKFKYSAINKILCVILCFVTFCSSVWIAGLTSVGEIYKIDCAYDDTQEQNDWTNSTEFYRVLLKNCSSITGEISSSALSKDFEKELKQNKKKYVDNMCEAVIELRNKAKNDYDGYDDEYDEDDNLATTMYSEDYSDYWDYYPIELNGDTVGTIDLNATMTRKDIEKKFDKELPNLVSNAVADVDYISESISSDATYVVTNDKETLSNVDAIDLNSPYYVISKHGKVESKGINKTVVNDVIGSLNENNKYFKSIDMYFAFTPKEISAKDIIAGELRSKRYDFSSLYEFSTRADKTVENAKKNFIISAILLIFSFIFGFMYFAITGKKREDESARLVFYDYLPLELSLALAGGLGVGAGMVAYLLADTLSFMSMLDVYAIFLFAVACWILLFFVSASLSRYIKSDKKFYKHLLTYWVLFALWKIMSWCFKQVKALFGKAKSSANRTINALFKKPKHFKRNIVLIAIGWVLINILFIGLVFIDWAMGISFFLGLLFALCDIAVNFFAIRKVAEYMHNLGKIIDSASRHEEIMLDLDTLDASLRTLAESMRYTNAELQNAIAKAVKDERLRTELITNVSHDLKTPLTSIITYVDLLSKCDINDEKAQEYIKVLDEKGGKLKRLIDDLIEASKVTSGNVTVNLTPMNLSELCLQATVDAQTDFEKAGLELVVKQGEKPTIVIADGSKANRVIENLLSNARKYSAKASRVYVSVYDENGHGVFEIKNVSAQPLDISPSELTERFVRGDKSRNQEGNGLGLSIAKELCGLQNGSLELIIDGDLFKARVKLPNK